MNYRLRFVMVLAVGLLLLVGCAANTASGTSSGPAAPSASATPSQGQAVHITISDDGISADRSTFSVGMSYHFVVTNTGQAAYQFMMGPGGWQDNRMPMGWQHHMTPYWSSQIAPGETKAFDYTIPASVAGQSFGFGCYEPGWQGGMWYPATVQPQGVPVTGTTQVTIKNFTYQPANMQVRVGTTVTWTNQDTVPHSVTFKNGMKESGLFSRGQSFSYTFNALGTYQYYCTVHPYMVATVTVIS